MPTPVQNTALTPPQTGMAPTPTPPTTTTDPGILSQMNTNVGNFVSSPVGQLATAATVGGLGYLQGQSAQNQARQMAGQITAPTQPLQNLGTGTIQQMQGGAPVAGPAGQIINQQLNAATNLGNVANQYSTGQLTPGQQAQLQRSVAQQSSQANLAFGAMGGDVTSAQLAENQQIANNAQILQQQLQQGNIQMAQSALQTVQSTYNGLLQPTIQSAALASNANAQAVALQIQQDTVIAASLNNLWGNLSKGLTTAAAPQQGGGGGSQAPGVVSQLMQKFGIGGTPYNASQAGDVQALNQLTANTPSPEVQSLQSWVDQGASTGTPTTDVTAQYAAPSDPSVASDFSWSAPT